MAGAELPGRITYSLVELGVIFPGAHQDGGRLPALQAHLTPANAAVLPMHLNEI